MNDGSSYSCECADGYIGDRCNIKGQSCDKRCCKNPLSFCFNKNTLFRFKQNFVNPQALIQITNFDASLSRGGGGGGG